MALFGVKWSNSSSRGKKTTFDDILKMNDKFGTESDDQSSVLDHHAPALMSRLLISPPIKHGPGFSPSQSNDIATSSRSLSFTPRGGGSTSSRRQTPSPQFQLNQSAAQKAAGDFRSSFPPMAEEKKIRFAESMTGQSTSLGQENKNLSYLNRGRENSEVIKGKTSESDHDMAKQPSLHGDAQGEGVEIKDVDRADSKGGKNKMERTDFDDSDGGKVDIHAIGDMSDEHGHDYGYDGYGNGYGYDCDEGVSDGVGIDHHQYNEDVEDDVHEEEEFQERLESLFSKARHNHHSHVKQTLEDAAQRSGAVGGKKAITVNSENKDGNTLLIICAQNNHIRLAKWLLNKGAEVNHRNRKGTTALGFCVRYNFDDMALWLEEEWGGIL